MPEKPSSAPNVQRNFLVLGSLVLVIAALYWAQKVLIPLALALLLTFILTPLVTGLQRWGLKRVFAVSLVVLLAFAVLGAVGWMVTEQVRGLLDEIPKRRGVIEAKIDGLRGEGPGPLQEFLRLVNDIAQKFQRSDLIGAEAEKPTPVVVTNGPSETFTWFPIVAGPVLEVLVTTILVAMLVVFMLVKREDLRNRLFRLVGHGRLTTTTRALDEAGQRISRFLLTQLLINITFGLLLGIGLFLIPGNEQGQGVPYAFLWGFLAVVLRFVPYLGTWVALLFPLTLSIAVFPGWTQPLLVLAYYTVLELATANVAEPLLFGHSAGVSPVALLVAAAFWTWLWGPLGLVMSTPLTVCLVVLGKYVPHLEFFGVLLGDEQPLETELTYYQRLLARDEDEATELVEEHLENESAETVYDEVLVPTLVMARSDRERGELSEKDEQFILQVTRQLVDEVIGPQQHFNRIASGRVPVGEDEAAPEPSKVLVLGCPSRDEADELALHMLAQLLEPANCQVEVISPQRLSSEVIVQVKKQRPALVCVASLPPGGLAQARYLCKRLRAQLPELKILVGRWGQKDNIEKTQQRLRAAGADQVATSVLESYNQVLPLIQVAAAPSARARRVEPQAAPSR